MPIGDLLAQITGEPSRTSTTFTPKRSRNGDLGGPVEKLQKTGTQRVDFSRHIGQPNRLLALDSSTSNEKAAPTSRSPAIQNSATSAFKNGQPTPPPTNDTSKPPKKGSYAEIMARGKAAQQTLGQVGKIQHKKIEKLPSRREREEMKARKSKNIQKALGPNSKFRTADPPQLRDGQTGTRENNVKVPPEAIPEKKVKKAAMATTGYAGTARPKPGSTKPASKSSPAASSSRYERSADRYQDRGGSSRPYAYASDEEEEEEEEEEEDYYSDASSDMEAAAFEVDEEEELAARIARREDADALAEENKHKREKEEKRRRLLAMAKKARR